MWSFSVKSDHRYDIATSHATIQANWLQDADFAFCFLRLTALNRVFSGIHFSLIRSSSRNFAFVDAFWPWHWCKPSRSSYISSEADLFLIQSLICSSSSPEYNLCPCHTKVTSCNTYNLGNYAWPLLGASDCFPAPWALLPLPWWPSDGLSRKNGTPAEPSWQRWLASSGDGIRV